MSTLTKAIYILMLATVPFTFFASLHLFSQESQDNLTASVVNPIDPKWCKDGETPATNGCQYLGSGNGG